MSHGLTKRPRYACYREILYDAEGSRLFKCITTVPEYCPRGRSATFSSDYGLAILAATGSDSCRPLRLLRAGRGDSREDRILLRVATRLRDGSNYIPVDVSSDALDEASTVLRCLLRDVRLDPRVGNYVTRPPKLERSMDHARHVHRFDIDDSRRRRLAAFVSQSEV